MGAELARRYPGKKFLIIDAPIICPEEVEMRRTGFQEAKLQFMWETAKDGEFGKYYDAIGKAAWLEARSKHPDCDVIVSLFRIHPKILESLPTGGDGGRIVIVQNNPAELLEPLVAGKIDFTWFRCTKPLPSGASPEALLANKFLLLDLHSLDEIRREHPELHLAPQLAESEEE